MAFLAFKHGRIDWLESNNEYWLERDARLRTDFNIPSGFQTKDMPLIKYKSKMKTAYAKAGIPTARWHLVTSPAAARSFIKKVGYPVVAKPDNGVGASDTWKIENNDQLKEFLAKRQPDVLYIMEEFVHAEVNSYDAIVDSNGEPIFETGNVTPMSIMDVVNHLDDSIFYILKDLPEDTRAAGRATLKSFGVRSRFVHFEFFRLTQDQEGLGKKGDLVGLEVNMRPSGGISPDMMNYANSTNVYKIWADMIAFDKSSLPAGEHHFCAFAGLRDAKGHAMAHADIVAKYGKNIKLMDRVPDALSGAMGNQMYLASFDTRAELDAFYADLLRTK